MRLTDVRDECDRIGLAAIAKPHRRPKRAIGTDDHLPGPQPVQVFSQCFTGKAEGQTVSRASTHQGEHSSGRFGSRSPGDHFQAK